MYSACMIVDCRLRSKPWKKGKFNTNIDVSWFQLVGGWSYNFNFISEFENLVWI